MRRTKASSAARPFALSDKPPVPFHVPQKAESGLTARRFGWSLGLVTFAAFLLRLGVSMELSAIDGGFNSVYFPGKATDIATYLQLGREIAAGQWPKTFYYQPFYYTVFLPLCNLLSGNSVNFVIVVQSLLGALAAGLAGLVSAKIFNRAAGLWAAGLAAVSTPLLLYTPFHMYETLQSFFLTLLLYLALKALEKNLFSVWTGTGIVFGCAILTRGNAWLLLPGLLAALIWRGIQLKQKPCRLLLLILVLAAATLAVQLPFALHNSRALGKISGPSTAADAVLALGNSKEAPPGGRDFGLPAGPMEYPEAFHQMMRRASQGCSVARQMGEWLMSEPAAFLELQFRKLLLFWDSHEIPNNVSLYGEGMHSRLLRLLVPGRSAIILTVALAAVFALLGNAFRRHNVPLLLLNYFLLCHWAGTALFYNLSRFRAPVIPLMAAAAGGFLMLAWQTGRASRRGTAVEREMNRRTGVRLLFCFFAAAWFVLSGWETYHCFEARIMRLVRPDGTRIEEPSSTTARRPLATGRSST